jgi:hypothetical protein
MKRLLDDIGARISLITPHPTKSELSAFETRENTLRPQLEYARPGAEFLSRLSLPTSSLEKEVQLAVQLKTLLTLIRERPNSFHSEEARTVFGEVRTILSNVDLLTSLLHQVVTDNLDVSSIKLSSWTRLMGTVANDLLQSDAKALLNKKEIRQGLVDSVGHFAFNHPHAGMVISVARKWKENLDLLNLIVDPGFSGFKEQIQKLLGEVRFKKTNVSTNSESLALLLDDSVAVLGFLSDKHKCSVFCSSLQALLKNYEVV